MAALQLEKPLLQFKAPLVKSTPPIDMEGVADKLLKENVRVIWLPDPFTAAEPKSCTSEGAAPYDNTATSHRPAATLRAIASMSLPLFGVLSKADLLPGSYKLHATS